MAMEIPTRHLPSARILASSTDFSEGPEVTECAELAKLAGSAELTNWES